MKLNKIVSTLAAVAAVAMLASCGSGSSEAPAAAATPAASEKPAAATEPPKYTFEGDVLKIELENMYYDEFLVYADSATSGGWAAKLLSPDSFAEAIVTFPAGTYEGLVSEDAPDGNHDAFNVVVDGVYYRTFPSDPPIGTFELTTRTPMKLVFDTEKTVTVRIQQNDPNKPNKPGENGMKLDFIQFTKK